MNQKTIIPSRTCATCSYSGGECMNMISFIVPGSHARDPLPDEVCDDHMTQRESDAEDAAIALFWQRLAITPRLHRVSD